MERIINASEVIEILDSIFRQNKAKRIVVLGTFCSGKSTIVEELPYARDMDEEIFPLLTEEETKLVCQTPWTEEIGEEMDRLVRKYLSAIHGHPLFETVYVDCDLVILLKLERELLQKYCQSRNVDIKNALKLQDKLEQEIYGVETDCIRLKIINE